MHMRRGFALLASGWLLPVAAGCSRDRPSDLGAGQQAISTPRDHLVNPPDAAGAQSEASLAANADASVLIAAYNDARGLQASPISLSRVARSTDRGVTWTEVVAGQASGGALPAPGGGQVLGSPRVSYDPTRDVFIVSSTYVRPADRLQGISIHVSGSGPGAGSTWGAPVEVTPSFLPGHTAAQASIDVNVATGRLSVTWVDRGSGPPEVLYSFSDDLGVTWSSAVVLARAAAGGALDGPSPRALPGTANADSVVYAVWRSGEPVTGARNIGCRRSIDGGASWEPAVDLDASDYPAEDQILGVERVIAGPSIDVDRRSRRVYVVYQRNDSHGTGDVALRAFVGACAAGAPVLLDANPGQDRAQFFPFVAVDRSTGTVHVVYYDQAISQAGDLTEVMHTASRDQGSSWGPPTPLSDRPFHAGYGAGAAGPNLGEYSGGVAVRGALYSLFGMTGVAPRFDEGQPASASMITPDVYCHVEGELERTAPLRVAATTVADSVCGPFANGRIDPAEIVDLEISLENYVASAAVSAATLTGVAATLDTATPGVTLVQGSSNYPNIAPLEAKSNETPFQLATSPDFVPGTPIDLSLTITSDQGTITLSPRLETGTPGQAVNLLDETFDASTDLPSGWQSVVLGGAPSSAPWSVAQTLTPGSNAAFHGESAVASTVGLFSPALTIPGASGETFVKLDFDVAYALEDDPSRLIQAFDGLTLRIADLTTGAVLREIPADAFAKEILTGAADDYPKHLPALDDPAYLPAQAVWSGASFGVKHVSMRFPGAGMRGRSVQLRFVYTQDGSLTCQDAGGAAPCGVAIDNVVLAQVPVESGSCAADLVVTQTHAPDALSMGAQVTYTIVVSNRGPSAASDVVVTDTMPAGAAFVSADGAGWSCAAGSSVITCRRDALAANASAPLTIKMRAPNAGGSVDNTVRIAASQLDPDPASNLCIEKTLVAAPTHLTGVETVTTTRFCRDTATYTVVLTNTGGRPQRDNPGHEFVDVLPSELALEGVTVTSGVALANPATNTVTWDGAIDPGATVVLTIQAQIQKLTEGLSISNQGTIYYDADGDGVNEATALVDDPDGTGASAPTIFVVQAAVCGDSTLGRGEDCDDGNLDDGDCCSSTCKFEASTVLCRPPNSQCDYPEYCDGHGHCPPNRLLPDGASCDNHNVCDGLEYCALGVCMPGVPLNCEDGDPNTTDGCDSNTGCYHLRSDPGSGGGSSDPSGGDPDAGAGGHGAGSGGGSPRSGGGDPDAGTAGHGAGSGGGAAPCASSGGGAGGTEGGVNGRDHDAGADDAGTDPGDAGEDDGGQAHERCCCSCAVQRGAGAGAAGEGVSAIGLVVALAGARGARRFRPSRISQRA